MSPSLRLLSVPSLVFALGGCIEFPEIPNLDEAGMETGPCVESQCFSGLACIQGVCVPDPEADDDDDDPTATSGSLPDSDDDDDSDSSLPGESDSASTTGSDTAASATQSGSDSVTDTASESDSESDTWNETDTWGSDSDSDTFSTGIGFISDPDGGGVSVECSIWEQDCPVGEKCNAWANDGGNTWNATRCVPIDISPRAVGQSCTVEGSGVSGVDTCVEGALCWDVDPETNEGTCEDYCGGSEFNPTCGFAETCIISNADVLALCLPTCDPLLQDCGTGQGCYGIDMDFACAPDGSGDFGLYGDPCESINACDPGLACIQTGLVPGCFGSAGCCSEFCDLNGPNNCAGAAGGQECVAWFEEGQAPPAHVDVGVCAIPT